VVHWSGPTPLTLVTRTGEESVSSGTDRGFDLAARISSARDPTPT